MIDEDADDTSLPAEEWAVLINPSNAKNYKADGCKIQLGASRIAKGVANEVLKHIKKSIRTGMRPEGGGQKPLKPDTSRAEKAAKGKRPKARGFTEHRRFVRSLRIRSAKRGKWTAAYEIASDMAEVFDPWQIDELARGVDYLPIRGDVEKVVNDVMDKVMQRMFADGPAKGATQ